MQAVAPGWQVDVQDNDYDNGGLDRATKWVGIGIGGFALLLGGLGLVNIALVTVRYRIREIGIRRSFGATSGRVFFGVLLESVVATVVAGLVGVVARGRDHQEHPGRAGLRQRDPGHATVPGQRRAGRAWPLRSAVGALAGLIPASVRRPGQGDRRHPVLTSDTAKRLCDLRWMCDGTPAPYGRGRDTTTPGVRGGADARRSSRRRPGDHPQGGSLTRLCAAIVIVDTSETTCDSTARRGRHDEIHAHHLRDRHRGGRGDAARRLRRRRERSHGRRHPDLRGQPARRLLGAAGRFAGPADAEAQRPGRRRSSPPACRTRASSTRRRTPRA